MSGEGPQPSFSFTLSGTTYTLPLVQGRDGRAWFDRQPTVGVERGIALGDTGLRTDYRTLQTVYSDLRDGAGTRDYQGAENITSYRDGDWDTRYRGALVLRTATVDRGALPATLNAAPIHVEYLGETGADVLAWRPGGIAAYHTPGSPGSWTQPTVAALGIDFVYGFTRYYGHYVLAHRTNGIAGSALAYSTNGTTWTDNGATVEAIGLAVHDGKLFWFNEGEQKIQWSSDSPTTAMTANRKSSAYVPLGRNERAVQVVRWVNAAGDPAIYLVTTHRLLGLNEVTGSVTTAFEFTQLVAVTNGSSTIGRPWATVWPRTGDLYISQYNTSSDSLGDQVIHLPVGLGVNERLGPNLGGGAPTNMLGSFTHLVGAYQWLYGFAAGRPGSGSVGGAWAMNDRGGWHRLLRDMSGVAQVVGGGYHGGTLWTVLANRAVREMAVPDTADSPQFAVGRSYTTGTTFRLELARNYAGARAFKKIKREIAVFAEKADGTPGLDTGAQVVVKTSTDGGAEATVGTLTGATTTWPQRLPVGGGTGTAGYYHTTILEGSTTDGTKTPIVTAVVDDMIPAPPQRYAYTLTVDTRDRAPGADATATPGNLSRARERDALDTLDGTRQLVAVAFGHGPDRVSLGAALVTIQSRNDAVHGDGIYTMQIEDFTSQNTG